VIAWHESLTRLDSRFLPNASTRVTINDSRLDRESFFEKSPNIWLTNTVRLHTKNDLFVHQSWLILVQIFCFDCVSKWYCFTVRFDFDFHWRASRAQYIKHIIAVYCSICILWSRLSTSCFYLESFPETNGFVFFRSKSYQKSYFKMQCNPI